MFEPSRKAEPALPGSLILPLVGDLYRVALSMTRSHDHAEELVAECVARALERIDTLQSEERGKQWLLRILTNLWLQDLRNHRRHPEVQLSDENESFSICERARDLLGNDQPERTLVNQMLDADIRAAIENLPDVYRVAIQLCDVEEMSYNEIAGILDVPIGTVRSRIARGRALLQHALWQHAIDHGLVANISPSTGTIEAPVIARNTLRS